MTYANDQVCIGDDGSLWILSDLWGHWDCGDIAGYNELTDWADDMPNRVTLYGRLLNRVMEVREQGGIYKTR